jgi:hypothetical protein
MYTALTAHNNFSDLWLLKLQKNVTIISMFNVTSEFPGLLVCFGRTEMCPSRNLKGPAFAFSKSHILNLLNKYMTYFKQIQRFAY